MPLKVSVVILYCVFDEFNWNSFTITHIYHQLQQQQHIDDVCAVGESVDSMMALPMNSLYSLTWGDYGTSLVSAIQLLRCHGDLVDCTLAAGGRSFPAHKIVLCAASPFLLDLLKVSDTRKVYINPMNLKFTWT